MYLLSLTNLLIVDYKQTMKVNHLTKDDKKRGRYLKALLIINGIEQQEIAKDAEASEALVSKVIHGTRKGTARNGKKIIAIKQSCAKRLGKNVEELFPDEKAA